jgi:hypothetical protein
MVGARVGPTHMVDLVKREGLLREILVRKDVLCEGGNRKGLLDDLQFFDIYHLWVILVETCVSFTAIAMHS